MTQKRDLEVGDVFYARTGGAMASVWIVTKHKKDVLTKIISMFMLGGSTRITLNAIADHEDTLAMTGRKKTDLKNISQADSRVFDAIFNEEVEVREDR